MTTARIRVTAVLGVVGIAGVVVALAAAAGPGDLLSGGSGGHMPSRGPVPVPRPGVAPSGPGAVPPQPVVSHGSHHGSSIAGSLLAVVAIVLAVWLLSRLFRWLLERGRRPRPDAAPPEVVLDPLPDALRVATRLSETAAAQRALLTAGEPRNAVIACWLAFETAAEGAGVPRRAWETSTEFAVRLLGMVRADPDAVRRLAALFREARFSTHPMGEAERTAAVTALDAIHAGLPAAVTP